MNVYDVEIIRSYVGDVTNSSLSAEAATASILRRINDPKKIIVAPIGELVK